MAATPASPISISPMRGCRRACSGSLTAWPGDKAALYRDLAAQLASLLERETDPIANAANMAALVFHGLPELNWAGFYFASGDELVLGPFQGKPACVRIPWGQGVCGSTVSR